MDPPAVIPDPQIRKAWMAWSAPVPINSIPDTVSASKDQLVYVLLTRDMTRKPRGAWQETLQVLVYVFQVDFMIRPKLAVSPLTCRKKLGSVGRKTFFFLFCLLIICWKKSKNVY